jgi:hypothetical protein
MLLFHEVAEYRPNRAEDQVAFDGGNVLYALMDGTPAS